VSILNLNLVPSFFIYPLRPPSEIVDTYLSPRPLTPPNTSCRQRAPAVFFFFSLETSDHEPQIPRSWKRLKWIAGQLLLPWQPFKCLITHTRIPCGLVFPGSGHEKCRKTETCRTQMDAMTKALSTCTYSALRSVEAELPVGVRALSTCSEWFISDQNGYK